MLPHPTSPDFPAALKTRRELRGMSRAELARAADIHEVMPRRYEEPLCAEFAKPRPETTWLALNRALGYEIPDDISQHYASLLHAKENGLFDSGPISLPEDEEYIRNDAPVSGTSISEKTPPDLLLKEASLEDIIKFLHEQNIEPTFRHMLKK